MYQSRTEAGRQLARLLVDRRTEFGIDAPNVIVVGLPRGGLPVAYEVATALDVPLDVILVRKLGVPFQPELAMGAIGEGGVRVLNTDVVEAARVSAQDLAIVEARARSKLDQRAALYRAGKERTPLTGRVVIIVDDGIATGSTAAAACQVARAEGAATVILAVPVAPVDWVVRLEGEADALVSVRTPEPFGSVGQFYRDFSQTSDDDVVALLGQAGKCA